jgi:lipid-A-disaccharide synthase
MENKQKTIFISANEPSADAHCAGLINAAQEIDPDIKFVGIGGEKMKAAGCSLIQVTGHKAAMAYNAFVQVAEHIKLLNKIKRFLKTEDIDLVIVCDSPAFNFHVAKVAKKLGIETMFYVAPQLWAWAPWRIKKLKKYCDKLCGILPFEKQWFTERGVDITYVGHPMLDALNVTPSENIKSFTDYDPSKASVALMPGSRPAEIKALWVPMQQIAVTLKNKFPNMKFTAVAPDNEKLNTLKEKQISDLACEYSVSTVIDTAKQVDFTFVASGSATLQVASAGCPMIIMYQSSPLLWNLVGKRLVTTEHLSLVNVIAQKKLVPEFMPYFKSIDPIVEKAFELLENKDSLIKLSNDLTQITTPLATGKASHNVARIAIDMIK